MADYTKYDSRVDSMVIESRTEWDPSVGPLSDEDKIVLAKLVHLKPLQSSLTRSRTCAPILGSLARSLSRPMISPASTTNRRIDRIYSAVKSRFVIRITSSSVVVPSITRWKPDIRNDIMPFFRAYSRMTAVLAR